MTEADSEIVGEEDYRSLGLKLQRGSRAEPLFGRFGVKPPPPGKLTVNCAYIFAHKRCEHAEKSAGLLQIQTPVEVHHPHPCICRWIRLNYSLSVTVLCVFIATVFAE